MKFARDECGQELVDIAAILRPGFKCGTNDQQPDRHRYRRGKCANHWIMGMTEQHKGQSTYSAGTQYCDNYDDTRPT